MFPVKPHAIYNQRRLTVQLDDHAHIKAVAQDAAVALFGFDPSAMVGSPLSGYVGTLQKYADSKGQSMLQELLAAAVER